MYSYPKKKEQEIYISRCGAACNVSPTRIWSQLYLEICMCMPK